MTMPKLLCALLLNASLSLLFSACECRLRLGGGGRWDAGRVRARRDAGRETWRGRGPAEPEGASTCAYKVLANGRRGTGDGGRVCFRTRDSGFHCNRRDCRVYRSGRSLVANVLGNSSVFLQWQPSSSLDLEAFRLNCTWSGIYSKFQCDSVELGASCRDYLFGEVHDSVEYRMCLQTVYSAAPHHHHLHRRHHHRRRGRHRDGRERNQSRVEEDCLQFVVEPAGMQDIVIAMTAVGGSICVMLVIICLLVAYITEKIMHPAFGRPSSRNGHCERSVIT